MRRVAPTGYISLLDAVERLAGTDVPREIKKEFYSEIDFMDDAELEEKATIRMRQALVDCLLTGVYQDTEGLIVEVSNWIWSDDGKCLTKQPHMAFERDDRFDPDGILIDELRRDVFLDEILFEQWRKKGASTVPPKSARPKHRQGRPVGADFDDSEWMPLIDELVEGGLKLHSAAKNIVEMNWERIDRRSHTQKSSVIRRLCDRYKAWKRKDAPSALEKNSD